MGIVGVVCILARVCIEILYELVCIVCILASSMHIIYLLLVCIIRARMHTTTRS